MPDQMPDLIKSDNWDWGTPQGIGTERVVLWHLIPPMAHRKWMSWSFRLWSNTLVTWENYHTCQINGWVVPVDKSLQTRTPISSAEVQEVLDQHIPKVERINGAGDYDEAQPTEEDEATLANTNLIYQPDSFALHYLRDVYSPQQLFTQTIWFGAMEDSGSFMFHPNTPADQAPKGYYKHEHRGFLASAIQAGHTPLIFAVTVTNPFKTDDATWEPRATFPEEGLWEELGFLAPEAMPLGLYQTFRATTPDEHRRWAKTHVIEGAEFWVPATLRYRARVQSCWNPRPRMKAIVTPN